MLTPLNNATQLDIGRPTGNNAYWGDDGVSGPIYSRGAERDSSFRLQELQRWSLAVKFTISANSFAILPVFLKAAVRRLGYCKFAILTADSVRAKFLPPAVKLLPRYLSPLFKLWRSSAIFDWLCAYSDHPRRTLSGFHRYAKFGWNRCSSFDNMQFYRFCEFDLKMPITAPFLRFLVHWPLNGEEYQRNHQKAHPCAERCHTTYRSSKAVHQCDLCAWRREQER